MRPTRVGPEALGLMRANQGKLSLLWPRLLHNCHIQFLGVGTRCFSAVYVTKIFPGCASALAHLHTLQRLKLVFLISHSCGEKLKIRYYSPNTVNAQERRCCIAHGQDLTILMLVFREEHVNHIQGVSCWPLKLGDNTFPGMVPGRVVLSSCHQTKLVLSHTRNISWVYTLPRTTGDRSNETYRSEEGSLST